jgi:hypothetical protein
MEGGVVNSRCPVCRHPERQLVDKELAVALSKETHIRGFSRIAKRYGVPYRSILVHAGTKKTGTPHYDLRRKSHLGTEAISQTVRCAIGFLKEAHRLTSTAFSLYVCLLLLDSGEQNDERPCLSPDRVSKEIGVVLTEDALLQGLNALLARGLIERLTRKFYGFETRCVRRTNQILGGSKNPHITPLPATY